MNGSPPPPSPGEQRQRGTLEQGGVGTAGPLAGAAEHQPAELVHLGLLRLGEESHPRVQRRSGDRDADPDVQVRAGRLDVEARVLDAAAEAQLPAIDRQLLAVRGVGAVDGVHGAVDRQAIRRRRDAQLSAQAAVEPAPADAQLLAHVDAQVERGLAAVARRRTGGRRRAGGRCFRRGCGRFAGRRTTFTSSPRVGASLRLKSINPSSIENAPSSAVAAPSRRSCAAPLATMRRSTRPRSWKRSASA